MYIYLIIIILIILIRLLLGADINNNKKIVHCIGYSIPLFVFSALRSPIVGKDTMNYFNDFIKISNTEWLYLLKDNSVREKGYSIYVKILTLMSDNPQILLIVTTFIFLLCTGYFIYKNSSSPFVSYILLITLMFYDFSLTATRQTIAISICLISFELIKRNRKILFICATLVAIQFHYTSWIFFLALFILNNKINILHLFKYIMIFFIIGIFGDNLFIYLVSKNEYLYNIANSNNGFITTMFIFYITLLTIVFSNSIINREKKNILLINAVIFGCILWTCRFISPVLQRASYYYYIIIIALIPELIFSIKNKKDKYMYMYSIISIQLFLLIYRILVSNTQYLFYWQN